MRKETIIKYEKEFLAWCKGESVLLGAPASMQDRTLIWREVRDFNDWKHLDTVYVLNDSYSIYRKALAEGKTVQYNPITQYNNRWDDIPSINPNVYDTIKNYRIKPDEPKFKVGDLVELLHTNNPRLIGVVKKLDISQAFIEWGNSRSWKSFDKLIFWQPKEDEWCWYKHLLVKVINVDKRDDGIIRYVVSAPMYAEQYSGAISLEPFTGTLPSFLEH